VRVAGPDWYDIVIAAKDLAMSHEHEIAVADDERSDAVAVRPKAVKWLWHPWPAKLWWAAITIYWAGKVGSFYLPDWDEFYTGALAGFLNIAFFPPLALMVLGVGFARAWFDASDWDFVEPSHEEMFPKRSVGGMRDAYSDPLDPRSGALHRRHFR
jgi:hypothetical protein